MICGHGNWLPWLDKEFGWSQDTAERLMRLADPKYRTLAETSGIPLSGLYLLTAKSTPDEAREAVIEAATSGEKVTYTQIKTAVRDARIEADDEPEPEEEYEPEPEPDLPGASAQPLPYLSDLVPQARAALTPVLKLIRKMTPQEREFFRKEARERWGAAMRGEPDIQLF